MIFTHFIILIVNIVQRGIEANANWEPISPLPDKVVEVITEVEVEVPLENEDYWVDKYARKYTDRVGDWSNMKSTLHCLLDAESKYYTDKGHGDGGRAGGPTQFHNPTYIGYRAKMIKLGHVDTMCSRYDMECAIETTAWALSTGRAKAWGPILRNECNWNGGE